MRTYISIGSLLSIFLLASAALAEDMEGWSPSAGEVALLPKYCWGQFEGSKFKGPSFEIPSSCGVGMNHYCPGLVVLNRANRSFSKPSLRRGYLLSARKKFEYTISAMTNYPECPLRGEVTSMYRMTSGLLGSGK